MNKRLPCFGTKFVLPPAVLSSGGSVAGSGGGTFSSFTTCVCLGGGLIAGFGGSAGLGLLSTSGVLLFCGVLLDCGGDRIKD